MTFRVLQLNKRAWPHFGGIERHLADLTGGLAGRRGVEVAALVCGGGTASGSEREDGVRLRTVRSFGTVWSVPVAPGYPAALRRLLRGSPAVVHLHEPFPLGGLSWLVDTLGRDAAPLVITWHSDVVRQKAVLPVYRLLLDALLQRAAAVIVPTERHITASRFLPAVREKCHVIPFGIDLERFAGPAVEAAGATLRGSLHCTRVVLFVGRLVYYKGLPVLLRAMQGIEGTLLLVGDGPDRAALERMAEACGVRGRVRFAGAVPDAELAAYYRAADVFVLPSTAVSEAFGIVQLEAMASSRPVVSTALPTGASTVNVDGTTGLIVAPGDAVALAAAVNRLLDDPALAQRFGAAARRRVVAGHSVESMVDATLALYRRVAAGQTLAEPLRVS